MWTVHPRLPALRIPAWVLLGVALIAMATLVLRLPNVIEPPWHDDEGIYAAVSHGMLRGETLYVDVTDNRPPGLYLLYAAMLAISGSSIPFIQMVAIVVFVTTQAVVFCLGWRLAGAGWGLAAAVIWGLVASLPLFDGNIPNAELFMALPTALGMLLLLNRRWFVAGVAFGLALTIKQVAGADFAAALLALFLFAPRPHRATGLVLAGVALPVALAAAWLVAQGTADDFLYAGFGYYLTYIQRGNLGQGVSPYLSPLKIALLAASCVVVWWEQRGPRSQSRFEGGLLPVWTCFALYGTLFTSRPYSHYLQQALLPGVLLLVVLLARVRMPRGGIRTAIRTGARALPPLLLAGGAAAIVFCVYFPWPRWNTPGHTVAYYQNVFGFMTGQRSVQAYNDFFDRRVNRNLALSRYLQSHRKPGDYLLVWGEEPWLYVLSDMRVAVPYTVAYFAWEMPDGLKQVVRDLQTDRPRFVIWTRTRPLFPELKAELDRNYKTALTMDNVEVLERTGA